VPREVAAEPSSNQQQTTEACSTLAAAQPEQPKEKREVAFVATLSELSCPSCPPCDDDHYESEARASRRLSIRGNCLLGGCECPGFDPTANNSDLCRLCDHARSLHIKILSPDEQKDFATMKSAAEISKEAVGNRC